MGGQMTTGQIVGSLVGAVIGGAIGYGAGAMIGMAIGGTIGGWIDPPAAPEPPPAGNVGLNSYVHNAPIALAYGRNKLYGGCIWIGNISVNMSEGGSKKSPIYTPNMDIEFAMAHCEGEVTNFHGYWFNENRYDPDALPSKEGESYGITTYPGTDTQTVNPTIEAWCAGGAAPAVPFIYTSYTYVNAHFGGGYFSAVPSYCVDAECLLTESGEKDANPIRVLYDFLTDLRYGAGVDTSWFDGDPDTAGSSWKIAADYCDELVSYVDGDSVTQNEPRFRYSHAFTSRIKGFDIVKDIVQSCRCILAWSQGLLYVKIEDGNEDVTAYYSDEYIQLFTATGSCTVNRIYFNEAIVAPDGFWEGTYLSFVIDDKTYSEMVNLQGADYVDLVDDLPLIPPSSTAISLTKDNIKEGTFNWNKSAKTERINSVRIEFINREWWDDEKSELTDEYQWDVVEHDEPLLYIPGQSSFNSLVQKQIRINGIKRKSQAMRMANFYALMNTYVLYYCDFVTDSVGYLHKVGDIIGIRHSTLGWEEKEFRIVHTEEIDNDEVKLYCLEYHRGIYGDDIDVVYVSVIGSNTSVFEAPGDIERFHVVQDETENKIYINIKRPDGDKWWLSARIYTKHISADAYSFKTSLTYVTPSIKLDTGGIDSTQTTIPYDSTTLYGAFPSSGEFWIEDELISYTSIDDVNFEFEGCTRGSNAASHADTEYCHLKTIDTPFITYDSSWVGQTYSIMAVSFNVTSIQSDIDTAPEETITIV